MSRERVTKVSLSVVTTDGEVFLDFNKGLTNCFDERVKETKICLEGINKILSILQERLGAGYNLSIVSSSGKSPSIGIITDPDEVYRSGK